MFQPTSGVTGYRATELQLGWLPQCLGGVSSTEESESFGKPSTSNRVHPLSHLHLDHHRGLGERMASAAVTIPAFLSFRQQLPTPGCGVEDDERATRVWTLASVQVVS